MREIKFRGWHSKAGKMFSAEEMAGDQLTLTTTGSFINVSGIHVSHSQIFPNDKFVPLQYTGLCDKNGAEIYEGDIIKWSFVNTGEADDDKEYTEPVEWNECGFFLDGGAPLTVAMDDCEVIGNIYENPDLIQ